MKSINLDKRALLFWWQRRTRGWDDSETWSLDYELVKWLLPRLKRFRELEIGHPVVKDDNEWERDLDKMIEGLEWYIDKKNFTFGGNKKERKKAIKKLHLIIDNLQNLWW